MIVYILWDFDPRVFHGFEFLRWYGVCWVLGMGAAHQIMLHVYKSENLPVIELDKLTTYLIVGTIIGARVGHILFYDPIYYLNNPIEILPFKINPTFQFTGLAGLASHGGMLGAMLTLYLFTRKYKKNYFWMLDRLMIAGTALGAFIRLGNLLNSEMIGTPSNVPWAFIFIRVDQIPRHPAQLYEALIYLLISIVSYFVWKSKKFQEHTGFNFGLGITLLFMQRFLIEFLKENQVAFEETLTLNMGQMLSIPLILGGVVLMIWSLKSSRAKNKLHEQI